MEATKDWEISQIQEAGPDFRAIAAQEAGLDGGLGGDAIAGGSALGGDLGGGLGDGEETPEFGDAGGELDDLGGGEEPTTETPPTETPEAPADTNQPEDEEEL